MSLLDANGRSIAGSSAQPVISVILEGRTMSFGANTILINKLSIESRKKILEVLTKLLLGVAALFVLSFPGCAARKPQAQTPHFWRDCQTDDRYPVSVKPGDQQHFICTEADNGKKWEVAVRPKQ